MASKVEIRGKGVAGLEALLKSIGASPDVKIGVFAGAPTKGGRSGSDNVEVATINEFGSPGLKVPERSFLRRTANAMAKAWVALLEKAIRKVVARKLELRAALELVGMRAAADVKKTITQGAGVPPPNRPSTIARKGSSRPLVDKGVLVASITWSVG